MAMRAVEITQPGGPEVLRPAERPTPVARENEILVKVAAASLILPSMWRLVDRAEAD